MQMKDQATRLFAMLVFCIAVGATGKSALACDCMKPVSTQEQVKRSSAVFVGVVTLAARADKQVVEFQVEQCWKGSRAKKLTLRSPLNSCNFGFKVGEKYLVFAEGGKALTTSICARTKRFDQATADLRVLGDGKKL